MLDTLIPNAKVSAKLWGTMLWASVPQGWTPTPPPVPPVLWDYFELESWIDLILLESGDVLLQETSI